MLQKRVDDGPLVVKGEIQVDGQKYPALRRALERGKALVDQNDAQWARVGELRRSGQVREADRLQKELLGIKPEPMSEETKAALRAKRAAMTDEEKQAEKEKRKADRILKRLAARRPGQGTETTESEDAMAKKIVAKSVKGAKAEKKTKTVKEPVAAKAPKERDPRLPAPGSTIERKYKGKDLSVKVLEQGFEFEGETFPSLTALALKITGAKAISGPAFFGLTKEQPTVEAK